MTLGRAEVALDLAQVEPQRAIAHADELLSAADLTTSEHVGALWARGRALSELDRVDEACATLGDAADLAGAAGLDALAAEVRVSRSVCLLTAGDPDGARRELDAAAPDLEGGPLGRMIVQRGLLEAYAGRLAPSLADFDAALPLLVAAGDDVGRCRLLVNRGIVHSLLGHLDHAEADLIACRDLAGELGQEMAVAAATHNLGFVRGRVGDVPSALRWLDEARRAYERLGATRLVANLEGDLCGVLLAGGLHAEAAEVAERLARAAAADGNRLTEAEARLLHARAELARGDAEVAERLAIAAAATFRRAGRDPWVAHAEHVALQAASARTDGDAADLLDRALALVGDLEENGWRIEASEVRTFAGRMALVVGRRDVAREALARSARQRGVGTATARANGWLATAALRLADGDRPGAKRAVGAGMRIVEAHRATLGATELRAHASAQAADLATLGLRMAVEDGRAADLLRWAERWRAGALAMRPVLPPRDGRLAHLLSDLRAAHAAAREAALSGGDDAAALAEVARVEAAIRGASRSTAGAGGGGASFDVGRLRSALAAEGAVLVEYVLVDDALRAVVVSGRRCRVVELGAFSPVGAEVALVLAALRRLALGRAGARSLEAARQSVVEVGAALERRLLAPLRLPGDGPVVVVPTADLQVVPWSVLPSLTARAVTVVPSAALWCRDAPSDGPAGGPTVLVGGPDLEHGGREIAELARLHPGATVLRHPAARVAAVLDAMSGAGTVHLAAHGTFRSDSPLFSSLQLSDGPLTVYDVEHLARPPERVVLPACDAARAVVERGDELMGTAAALLSIGVRSVVAPVTVVSDAAAVQLVVDVHRALLAGASSSAALAAARIAAIDRGGPQDLAAAHSMVAIGARAG